MNSARLIHLIAHRGNAREFPENTLPAFESALALGLRFLELDVQICADGVPMVIHDHELARTTGQAGSVFDLTAAQLARIDAHEPERFGERFRGTCIPRLTQVLALLEGRPEVTLFVEIKRASIAQFGREQVVASVVNALKPVRAQCVLISFDLAAIHQARSSGEMAVGWVLTDYDAHSRIKYESLRPDFLICDHRKLPANEMLWRGPWRWVIYEIDSVELAMQMGARGADYLETMAVRDMSAALLANRSGTAGHGAAT